MNKQQIFALAVLILTFYAFFINNPDNLKSLADAMSRPASEFYGCKAFPLLIIFIIEAITMFALLTKK